MVRMTKAGCMVAVVIAVGSASRSARADVAPPQPEACATRAHGDRCFDALGRPGRCVPEPYSNGRCNLTEDSATPMTSSTSTTPSSEPRDERQSTSNRSGGCSAPSDPLVGGGRWVISVLVLLVTHQLRRRPWRE